MRPIQATLTRCNGTFLPSFVSYSPSEADLGKEAVRYAEHVQSAIVRLAQ
ncbi:hypothetical protein [Paenibacillus flagellatus]|nr:hypothetical protein [Paenibacillus flagellatus]